MSLIHLKFTITRMGIPLAVNNHLFTTQNFIIEVRADLSAPIVFSDTWYTSLLPIASSKLIVLTVNVCCSCSLALESLKDHSILAFWLQAGNGGHLSKRSLDWSLGSVDSCLALLCRSIESWILRSLHFLAVAWLAATHFSKARLCMTLVYPYSLKSFLISNWVRVA